jgi:hypothetical protein
MPGRLLPALAGGTVVALALPIFLIGGWPLAGWALGATLWAGGQALGLLLMRFRADGANVAGSGVLGVGMMFRAVAVMAVLLALAASDASLAVAAAVVYALAYTLELALSVVTYFGSAT